MFAHSYAVDIEHSLRRVFDCERGGFAGLIDADTIEHNWYPPIACGLGYMYAQADLGKRGMIEKFIKDYDYYLDFGLTGLLDFKTNEKSINGSLYSIDYPDGEAAVDAVVSALKELCK